MPALSAGDRFACLRKAVADATGADPSAPVTKIELDGLPGGADAFEKATRYCYGANFEISARNAAALPCKPPGTWYTKLEPSSAHGLI